MGKSGLRKDDGRIDWKKAGPVLCIVTLLALFLLMLIPQLIPSNTFMDKNIWIDSCKYCIDKFIYIAGIECGGCAAIGAVAANNSNPAPEAK